MKKKSGFTLIELIIIITIISILTYFGLNNLNYNRLNNKQKLSIFINTIINNYEEIRNNALLGKGIGISLENPKKWKIDFSDFGSGKIISSYYSGGLSKRLEYNKNEIKKGYDITNIECISLNGTHELELTNQTGTIEIEGSNITLSGACNDDKYKILKLTIDNKKQFQETIEFNVLNGIINNK